MVEKTSEMTHNVQIKSSLRLTKEQTFAFWAEWGGEAFLCVGRSFAINGKVSLGVKCLISQYEKKFCSLKLPIKKKLRLHFILE